MKKKLQITLASFCFVFVIAAGALSPMVFTSAAHGMTVTCVNCSNIFTQLMEYIKDIEQLSEAVKRYEELVEQTTNAITNTMNLPTDLVSNIESQIKEAASSVTKLTSFKADMESLSTIFTDTWPELKDFKVDGMLMTEKIKTRVDQFKNTAEKIDDILQSNFKLTGQQLQDLTDSGDFDSYVSDLLSSKTGRQQAIEAGNQINALTVNEMRQTRALLASYVQAQSAVSAQNLHNEKDGAAEIEREMSKGVELDLNLFPN